MDQLQYENRIVQLEKEITEMKELFDSLFKGSTSTRLYLKYLIAYDRECKIGFFGADPVKKPTVASDTLANLYTALRTLGLIT